MRVIWISIERKPCVPIVPHACARDLGIAHEFDPYFRVPHACAHDLILTVASPTETPATARVRVLFSPSGITQASLLCADVLSATTVPAGGHVRIALGAALCADVLSATTVPAVQAGISSAVQGCIIAKPRSRVTRSDLRR